MFGGVEPDLVLLHLHVRVDLVDRDLGRVDLGHSDAVVRVRHLALEVRQVDHVVVDEPERAHARGREVEGGGRAEAARPEQQHLRVEQLQLALEPDLGHEQVARVALALLGGERPRDLDLVAAVLPERDPAAHRRDVLVAEQVLHRLGGERRAVARRAVEDDAPVAVGDGGLDARLEVPARHVHGAGQVGLLELVLLADVDDHGAVAVLGERVDVLRIDLLDLLLDLADEFCAGRHVVESHVFLVGIRYFRKYSAQTRAPQKVPGRPFGRPGGRPRPRFCGSPGSLFRLPSFKPHQEFRLSRSLPIWGGDPICPGWPRSDPQEDPA